MIVRLYGTVALVGDGDGVERPVGRKLERAVLAMLATRPNEAVSTDALVDAFWSGDPVRSRSSLRVRVANIRRALAGTGAEVTRVPEGYRLDVDNEAIDLHRFARLVAEARQLTGAARLERLDEADRCRAEPPLAEFGFDDFALPVIRRDHELWLEASILRAEAQLELGLTAEVVSEVTPLVDAEPVHEGLLLVLMRGLAASGRVADALESYRAFSERMAEHGLEPSESARRMEEAVLLGRCSGPVPGSTIPAPALPAPPALIGRDDDLLALLDLVETRRFVTIIGPPGVGKTSVAAAASHELVAVEGRRVAWAELVDLEPDDFDRQLVARLRLDRRETPIDALVGGLSGGSTLLVLDNCEHLLSPLAGLIGALLARLPELTILATSRIAFGHGQRFPLQPLPTPSVDASPGAITSSPSVALFGARAEAIDPAFTMVDHLQDVAELCRALDGVPLAIELAASRTSVLSAGEIRERLDDRFRILSDASGRRPAHHRTLLQTLEWSMDLLSPPARELLGRLSVFRAGVEIDGVRSVAPSMTVTEALDGLDELVRHSLVSRVPGRDPARFRLFESVADAAECTLDEAGRQDAAERHQAYMASLARAVVDAPCDDTAELARARLDRELANLQRAMTTSRSRPHLAAGILADSYSWWLTRGHWDLAASIAPRLLAHSSPSDPELRHRFYVAVARIMLFNAESGRLLEFLDDVDALGRSLGQPPLLDVRALAMRIGGDIEGALVVHGLHADQLSNEDRCARIPLGHQAVAHTLLRDYGSARKAAKQAIAEARRHDEGASDTAPAALACVELLDGNDQTALDVATEWLERIGSSDVSAAHRAEAMIVAAFAQLNLDRRSDAAATLIELLPIVTQLGGTHLNMTFLVVALAALGLEQPGDAERLVELAEQDAQLSLRPELDMVRRRLRRNHPLPERSPTSKDRQAATVDALRRVHEIVTQLS